MSERDYLKLCLFIELQSYTEVAKELGVSRQAVEQTIRRSDDPLVLEIKNRWREKKSLVCRVCRRSNQFLAFIVGVELCYACYQYERSSSRRKTYRSLFYPRVCIDCGINTEAQKRCWGRCRKCFAKARYNEPGGREKIAKINKKSNDKHREARRAHMRVYYHKNRGWMIEYFKQRIIRINLR